MRLLSTASLLCLGVFASLSQQSPIVEIENRALKLKSASTTTSSCTKSTTTNTCALPWIQVAEQLASLVPHNEVASLCSSALNKYATTTTTVYDTIIPPTTVLSTTATAPTPLVTNITTISDIVPVTSLSTSTTILTAVDTVFTTNIVTDFTTVYTTVAPMQRRDVDPHAKLGSLLNIASSLVNSFCSCEAPGPTSTATITTTGTTTANPATITTTVATSTPATSIVVNTQVLTITSIVTTIQVPATSLTTYTELIPTPVTDIVTVISTATSTPTSGTRLVVIGEGTYSGYYAFIVEGEGQVPIQFAAPSSSTPANYFAIDSAGHLNTDSYTAQQNIYSDDDNPYYNAFFMAPANIVASNVEEGNDVQPSCSIDTRGRFRCSELTSGDFRDEFSMCPSTVQYFGSSYADTPFLVYDDGQDDGCVTVTLTLES